MSSPLYTAVATAAAHTAADKVLYGAQLDMYEAKRAALSGGSEWVACSYYNMIPNGGVSYAVGEPLYSGALYVAADYFLQYDRTPMMYKFAVQAASSWVGAKAAPMLMSLPSRGPLQTGGRVGGLYAKP